MATRQQKRRAKGKKHYTPQEANAALPLVRAIVRDIRDLAVSLHERHERLARTHDGSRLGESYDEENRLLQQQIEQDHERFQECVEELAALGVELKDPFIGLIDFRSWMNDREVYLCWKLDEPEVAYWHELHAGFAGRQKLAASEAAKP